MRRLLSIPRALSEFRACPLRLYRRQHPDGGHEYRCQAGADDRHCRPDRRRQNHAGQSADALLRGQRRSRSWWMASISPRSSAVNLRRTFGMVLQDTWLFNGTIRDNIAYGRENATESEIIRAAKAAYADHFIRTLPEGYNTVLNEEATNISQGQKQLADHCARLPGRSRDPDSG